MKVSIRGPSGQDSDACEGLRQTSPMFEDTKNTHIPERKRDGFRRFST